MKESFFEFHADGLTFESTQAPKYRMIYAPLCGPEAKNLKSAITPGLSGDIKIDKFTYVTKPASREDLRIPVRNFYLTLNDGRVMAVSSHAGCASKVMVGPLWHQLTQDYQSESFKIEVLNFIPSTGDNAELMRVRVANTSAKTLSFTPTAAVPIFGRALANKHDHEHVTALLHRIEQVKDGVIVSPTMSFDEEGHKPAHAVYFVFGATASGQSPVGTFPTFESFYGESGDGSRPQALVDHCKPELLSSKAKDGKEAVGALQFAPVSLKAGECVEYIVAVGIAASAHDAQQVFQRYHSSKEFDAAFRANQDFWKTKISSIDVQTGDLQFNAWMRWVTLQPILRRIFGCSFLPDHDYGKGGKGWRDLWQDLLSLILIEPEMVRDNLINNFGGVRIDGSNATIIGTKPGEFLADRNAITRVWMDHGAWPLLTMLLYMDQTGDYKILLENNAYFRDPQMSRTLRKDATWTPQAGRQLKDRSGKVYQGTILEHLLLQNLVPFFNVGEHNVTRLESADWNDGLDMAFQRGESVAFMSFYAGNLVALADLLEHLPSRLKIEKISVFKEMAILLDTLNTAVNYNDISVKKDVLFEKYFKAVQPEISGEVMEMSVHEIAKDLRIKAQWMMDHVRKQEKISVKDPQDQQTRTWYNGYYDNQAKRVEGLHENHVRMTLTGQVFAIMQATALETEVSEIVRSVDHYLKDSDLGGIRLNSDFHVRHYLDFGRAFGFAYGTKENGAFFSHMNVMYAYALYKRGFVREGHAVLSSIYKMSMDTRRSKIYPGIPEYFDSEGRGMYHYLTGSASWLVLTELTQVFGVRGEGGDLLISPKLVKEEFGADGSASVVSFFAGKRIRVTYENPQKLDFKDYKITQILRNGHLIDAQQIHHKALKISRQTIVSGPQEQVFVVKLG